MKPVAQAIDKIPGGDCFKACVASILEINLDDVPHFCENGKNDGVWFVNFRSWLNKRGVCPVIYEWGGAHPPQALIGYCLVSVQSKHPDAKPGMLHSVVGRSGMDSNGELELHIVHDPNSHNRKSDWGLEDIKDVIWMVQVQGDKPAEKGGATGGE